MNITTGKTSNTENQRFQTGVGDIDYFVKSRLGTDLKINNFSPDLQRHLREMYRIKKEDEEMVRTNQDYKNSLDIVY